LAFTGINIYVLSHASRIVGLPFYLYDQTLKISGLRSEFASSGLKVNDEIVALNGQSVTGSKLLDEMSFSLHPGDQLMVKVSRVVGGQRRWLDIPVRLRSLDPDALSWVLTISSNVLALSCLLIGFYIAFARPYDPLAWIALMMLLSFGHIAHGGTSWAMWSPWRELLFIYHPILSNSWPLWLVLFALYFPVPFEYIQKRRWPQWILALPCIVLSVIDIYSRFREGTHMSELGWVASFSRAADRPLTVLFTLYIFGFFYLLNVKKHQLPNNDARRRMGLMIWGCSAALLPLLPVALAESGMVPRLPAWLTSVCLLMLVLFPLTMAYVIVVQQAMDVRMVVRTGVRYAIASNGLKVMRLLLLAGLAALTIHLTNQSGHRWQAVIIASAGTAVIIGFRNLATKASNWMDRRFFREAYDAEVILTELSNSVASIRDVKLLAETVARRIAVSLHIGQVAVLLDQNGRYRPVYAMGFDGPPPVEFTRSASTIRLLRQMNSSPSKVHFDDPQSWVHGTPISEQAALQSLGAEILLPVTLKSRILGLISLGPKRSEAPYSREDLHLLGAVASQTGLALENAELTESIRREIAQRERLDRELEIAREVQQRLFPQTLPVVKGLEFAGYCRPALGVGGDYYDFIRLQDGCLGVAIGDVSGKGIAAALMMASLQASLRGQTIKPCSTLAEMIQHVNHLVYEASAANRYATFFYAQYDPACRQLHYVNAGHNPPIVYRKNGKGAEILRLEEGGTVVGLFPEFPYQEAELKLEAGDLFVCFTDGISEAMDTKDDEFGEERLIETLRRCQARSAAKTI
ncbi:MAG: SpoIIE family protein phosphatase, partial [Acidobacteriaceae bacterium]|nr:SpoIIE family protein phosphatase [Acidobacteriaceae bacterium]